MKPIKIALALCLVSTPLFAQSVTRYLDLMNDPNYVVGHTQVLENGAVILLVYDNGKNPNMPSHICHLHRKLAESQNDECRQIGH